MPKKLAFFKIVIFTLFFASILFLNACKKDENTEPPKTTESTPTPEVFTNKFFIYEHWKTIPIDWDEYDTDTILTQSVKLKGEVENGTYEWDINGIPFTTREIILDSVPTDSLITVKYKVSKDGETDSLTRKIIRLGRCTSLVDGEFKGKVEGSNLTRVMKFSTVDFCKIIRGEGLSKGCAQNFPVSYIGYKQIAFASTTHPDGIGICNDPVGLALYNTNTKELTIKYKLISSPTPKQENIFTGTK